MTPMHSSIVPSHIITPRGLVPLPTFTDLSTQKPISSSYSDNHIHNTSSWKHLRLCASEENIAASVKKSLICVMCKAKICILCEREPGMCFKCTYQKYHGHYPSLKELKDGITPWCYSGMAKNTDHVQPPLPKFVFTS